MSARGCLVVVAEDEENDVLLVGRAIRKAGIAAPVQFARDGSEAVKIIETLEGEHVLLLLDLKMPGMDGFQVLSWLNQRPVSADVASIVLSSSETNEDIRRAGALGAAGYIVKPHEHDELVRALERVREFWKARASRGGWPFEPVTENAHEFPSPLEESIKTSTVPRMAL